MDRSVEQIAVGVDVHAVDGIGVESIRPRGLALRMMAVRLGSLGDWKA